MRDDAELVIAARTGEPDAFGPLVERWLDRCWEVAWRILHDRDLAADVAQETLLTAWQQLDRLDKPASFGGWVLRIARNRALNRLERERRAVPTGDPELLEPHGQPTGDDNPAAALGRAEQHDLVWAAAAALGERDVSILDLHLRHGLEPAELADELGIAPNAAHQALFRLRKRLGGAIQAWLLWKRGDPDCVVLRAELAAAGIASFGADAVRVIEQHVASCVACAEERERVSAPAALFSAVPLVVIPAAARAEILGELVRAGVPVTGPAPADGAASGTTGASAEAPGSSEGASGAAAASAEAPGSSEAAAGSAGVPTAGGAGPEQGGSDGAGSGVEDGGGKSGPAWPWLGVAALLVVLALIGGLVGGWWLWPTDPAAVVQELTASALDLEEPEAAPLAVPGPLALPSDQGDGLDPFHGPLIPLFDVDADGDLADADADGAADATEPPPEQTAPEPEDDPPPDPSDGHEDDDPVDPDPEEPGDDPEEPQEPPPPAPVVIGSFTVEVVDACRDGDLLHHVAWTTSGADTATLSVDGGDPEPVETSGQVERCAPRGSAFTLVASGPGGTAEATETAG